MKREHSAEISLAAGKNIKERDYWLKNLAGELVKSSFPPDRKHTGPDRGGFESVTFEFPGALYAKISKMVKGSDVRLHVVLATGVVLLLNKYTGLDDIVVGTPVYRQEIEGRFVNTVLVLRNRVKNDATFKELLLQVRETVGAAAEHQNYPIETLLYKLDIPYSENDDFPLFDVVVMLDNIHDKRYILHTRPNIVFSFSRSDETLEGVLEYNPLLYGPPTAARIAEHFLAVLEHTLFNIDSKLAEVAFLTEEEKKRLLVDFNDTKLPYPEETTIPRMFESQVEKTPDSAAVVFRDEVITYRELNRRAGRLAGVLRAKGVGRDAVAAVLEERSIGMMVDILGVLKAGGAYLPLDTGWPEERILYTLRDCRPSALLIGGEALKNFSFTALRSVEETGIRPRITAPRKSVADLDSLPMPDRSQIDAEKYARNISLAMVTGSMNIQATRGCPYDCAYCAKLWPRKHVARSAEHIFAEVKFYYDMGVKRFSFIDDIFNLKVENSERFFQLVIENGLDIQILFPAGLRGDIMTGEYIDLMVNAGTINISVALETASPRLQKLIKKDLDIEKLRANLEYICEKHPHVILDLFTMHGFPTETEEEALMTLEFITSLKWLHFPLINILKIYPNTDMEKLALESGIDREAITRSEKAGWHEFSDTLPFDKEFTSKYQTDFLNDYFLLKERLLHVLPYQMQALTEYEIVTKYNSYLSEDIRDFEHLLEFFGIAPEELGRGECVKEDEFFVPGLNEKISARFPAAEAEPGALRVLLLDLSQSFPGHSRQLEELVEPPLGLMYLMTWLKKQLGGKIDGKIAKSGIDFVRYSQLKELLETFKPDVIGIRTLTFYKEFFHQTVSVIKQWGFDVPIIAGGPYATNSYVNLLQDGNVDLVVLAEGEITFTEVVEKILAEGGKLPGDDVLEKIPGIVFMPREEKKNRQLGLEVVMPELTCGPPYNYTGDIPLINSPGDLAYVIFTSGSTGRPKGVMIEQRSLVNLVSGLEKHIYSKYAGPLRIALAAAYSFDASVKQIFVALLKGHTLHIVPEDVRLDGGELVEFFKGHQIDISDGTPAHIELLRGGTGGNESVPHLKHFIIGGEELPKSLVESFYRSFGDSAPAITNVYGPTECCVDATYFDILPGDIGALDTIPIGKPMPNVRVYMLGPEGNLMPPGVPGELCISGIGVGRGYLGKPGLTSERFVHSGTAAGRYYRTGDLARWLPGGNIEFLGRVDRQVKIRGYRIALEEIENRVREHKQVTDAAVIVRDGRDGDKTIRAYVVSTGGLDAAGLKKHLSAALPGYMVPPNIVFLDAIPLTVNGKVDKRALPEPEVAAGAAYTAPASEIEKKLACLWSEVLLLDADKISSDADFFEIGGHSLKAVILVSKIHKELGVKIPIVEIFESPTIKGLGRYVKESKKKTFVPVEPAEEKEYYPLSSPQKRLYIMQRMDTESAFYNIPYAAVLGGSVDGERLERTIKKLVKRHESLRTSFEMIDRRPVQRIHGSVEFEIEYEDLSGEETIRWESLTRDFFGRAFDMSKPPLLKVKLIKKRDDEHLLAFDMHHIISDAVSVDLFIKEFIAVYSGKTLSPLPLQYRDYSEWQNGEGRGETFKRREEYWLKRFSGEVPVLNLPTDHPRPTSRSFEGKTRLFELSVQQTHVLNELALAGGTTLYTVLLGVLNVLLAKLTGGEDIVVGTPTAGRGHADLEKIIGVFINTLPMRNFPEGNKTFRDFLEEVKEGTLEAFENQDYPFEDLVERVAIERDTGRNPLFDVGLGLQNMETSAVEIPGLKLTRHEYESGVSRFDLSLQGRDMGRHLMFHVEYCTGLFEERTIERFTRYFAGIVDIVTRNPGREISGIEIISEEEKKQLLIDFNNTGRPYPASKTIAELFEEEATRNADRPAVSIIKTEKYSEEKGGELRVPLHFTYGQLNERADRLARVLRDKGVRPGVVVGVMVERSLEMIAALTAILKAGGAYLPMGSNYPAERIAYMLADSNAGIVLTRGGLWDKLEGVRFNGETVDLFDETIYAPTPGGNKNNAPWGPPPALCPGDPAYIMYTSGSTGKPKGVVVEHGNVVKLAKDPGFIELSTGHRLLLTGNLVFDITTFEIWGALLNGLSLYLADREAILDGNRLRDILVSNRIDILHLVPQVFNQLASTPGGIDIFAGLKYFLVGGDLVRPKYVNQLRNKFKDLEILHMYGPTENTTFSTFFPVDKTCDKKIPIGKPIDNSTVYILDKYDNVQPAGVVGELCTGGRGVTRGYLNNPELTAEKFTPVPDFNAGLNAGRDTHIVNRDTRPRPRLYRTGDLARWGYDGNIEFFGRVDSQVKIRGMRIELGEIEKQLLTLEGINDVVVITGEGHAPGGADDREYLCAYIVADKAFGVSELRETLSGKVPDYMIPAFFVQLDHMPLTVNGKVDKKALPAAGVKSGAFVAPRDETERKLAKIWAEILELDETSIGIDDNFFELGGHSLKATILISTLHKEMNTKISVADIFRRHTVRALAAYIKEADKHTFSEIEPVEKREYYTLSSAQKRIYIVQQMDRESTAYNIPLILELGEIAKKEKLNSTFRELIHRHEILRTSFETVDDEPVQRVHDGVEFEIEALDEFGLTDFFRPFDLAKAPLLRAGLLKRGDGGEERDLLAVAMHHITADGFSVKFLSDEFFALNSGEAPPPLKLQYKDYAQWQNRLIRSGELKKQERYWLNRFKDHIPLLTLPTDYPRTGESGSGARVSVEIGGASTEKIRAFVLDTGTTMFIFLLAVYTVLLAKYANRETVVVGCPTADRPHHDLNGIIGMFANMTAMKNLPSAWKTFRQFLEEVKENAIDAFENQNYPFEELVDKLAIPRQAHRNPLTDVVFSFRGEETEFAARDGEERDRGLDDETLENKIAKFEIDFQAAENRDKIVLNFDYREDLFKRETMEKKAGHFLNIIEDAIAHPDKKLSDIDMLDTAEMNELKKVMRDTPGENGDLMETPAPGNKMEADFDF